MNSNQKYSKDFKYSIKTKEGKVLVEEIVTFGNKEKPFPADWKNDGIALMTLLNYEEAFLKRHLDITHKEFNPNP